MVKGQTTKFMFSMGDQCFRLLEEEARTRDITVQQLIRAVVIPDWIKQNIDLRKNLELGVRNPSPIMARTSMYPNGGQTLQPQIGRLRT